MFGQKRIPSREGGVEIVVEELSTRMVKQGHEVTCYNRKGHHVSGKEYDIEKRETCGAVKIKTVPTIDIKGLAAVSSAFLQLYVLHLGNMMWYIFMQRDQPFFVGYLKWLAKKL